MTTIACDGRMMAGDGQVTCDNTVHDLNCVKVFRLNDGSIVGMAGAPYFHEQAVEFLNGKRDSIDFGEHFEALILVPDGFCFCMDEKGRKSAQSVPCASGSGADFALAAMRMGRNAKDAVALAAEFDICTGGTITCHALAERKVEAA